MEKITKSNIYVLNIVEIEFLVPQNIYLDSLMTFLINDLNPRYDKMWNRWSSWTPSWIYQMAQSGFLGTFSML